jgi:hypothetical protein
VLKTSRTAGGCLSLSKSAQKETHKLVSMYPEASNCAIDSVSCKSTSIWHIINCQRSTVRVSDLLTQ